MKKSIKIPLIIFLVLVVLLVAVYFCLFYLTKPVAKVNSENESTVRIEIPEGMTVSKVAKLLKEQNLIKNEKIFYYSARFPSILKFFFQKTNNDSFLLKSGIYYVKNSMNIAEIQDLLSSGQTEYVKVSIPEGLTKTQIAQILEQNRICTKDDFLQSVHNSEILENYKIPSDSAEGYLFPDTYFLNYNMSSDSVVKIMIDNFFEKIKEVKNLSEKNPEDLFQTVILASIVEKEYGTPEEAPLIASVFKNRLKINMGLYSCATVVYIVTEIQGKPHPSRITEKETSIDNPYNTYKWAGLTPGPISNPGLIALDASTNTPKTKYYYFQVVDPKTGRQEFTETFDEHKINHNYNLKK